MKHSFLAAMVIGALLTPMSGQTQENSPSTATDSSTAAAPAAPAPADATSSQPATDNGNPAKDVSIQKPRSTDQGENCIRNGDFTSGKASWKGSGTVVNRGDYMALSVELRARSVHDFATALKLPVNARAIHISFDVEASADTKPKGSFVAQAFYTIGDTTHIFHIEVKPGEKQAFSITLFPPQIVREIPLTFEIQQGSGTLYFSNFVAVPPNGTR